MQFELQTAALFQERFSVHFSPQQGWLQIPVPEVFQDLVQKHEGLFAAIFNFQSRLLWYENEETS